MPQVQPSSVHTDDHSSPHPTGLGNELLSVALCLVGLFTFLALATGGPRGNLVGSVGAQLYEALTFTLGRYVAFLIPVLLMASGTALWRGDRIARLPERGIGLFFSCVAFAGILSIAHSNTDFRQQPDSFFLGGAIGNFLMHRDCLNLSGHLGLLGAALVLAAVLSSGVLLTIYRTPRSATYDGIVAARRVRQRAQYILDTTRSRFSNKPYKRSSRGIWTDRSSAPSPAAKPADESPRPTEGSARSAAAAVDMSEVDAPEGLFPRYTPDGQLTVGGRSTMMSLREISNKSAHADDTNWPAPDSGSPTATLKSGPVKIAEQVMGRSNLGWTEERDPIAQDPEAAAVALAPPPVAVLNTMTQPTEMQRVPAEVPRSGMGPLRMWPGSDQMELPFPVAYDTPDMELLDAPPEQECRMPADRLIEMSEQLQSRLAEFGVSAEVEEVIQGPAIIRFEVVPAQGQRINKIAGLEKEIALSMLTEHVRVIGPLGGRGTVGIEIPSPQREVVRLREIMESEAFQNHPSPLAFCMGKTISGEPFVGDLAAMPHLLIAGATGQGKSVCLNSILCSFLYRLGPDKLRIIMVDPKQVELTFYRDIPHLLAPIVVEPKKAAIALGWACEIMEHRYQLLRQMKVRNIDGYNALVASGGVDNTGTPLEHMPYIVVVVDEMYDLMIQARKEVEDNLGRLAAKARAAGIHLIVATQRPSVDVITGVIKANFPSRIAFYVRSDADSRTILDQIGAESLLGKGDMLFDSAGAQRARRIQGCFVADMEVERLADYARSQMPVQYLRHDFPVPSEDKPARNAAGSGRSTSEIDDVNSEEVQGDSEDEILYARALRLVFSHRKASVSLIQRKMSIGFPKASRLMDLMEERGIVGPAVGSKVREFLVDPDMELARILMEADGSSSSAMALSPDDETPPRQIIYDYETPPANLESRPRSRPIWIPPVPEEKPETNQRRASDDWDYGTTTDNSEMN